MTLRVCATLASLTLALAAGSASAGPAPSVPASLTVYVTGTPRTALYLQPGFATVLRADRRIDTVAIGDPRLVTATAVRRGQDVYDLILQAQSDTGATNMVVWFGDLTTIWDLEIGPGHRTADLVYVITNPRAVHSEAPTPGAAPPLAAAPAPATGPVYHGGEPSPMAPSPAAPSGARGAPPGRPASQESGPPLLEVRQAVGDITGTFQIARAAGKVVIRYRITNGSRVDLTIHPGGVLVRVNGQVVPYGMARDSADRKRPEILPRGATETGVIGAPSRSPRRVQLVFSLVPAAARRRTASLTPPITFQPAFTGVDLLAISSAP